MNQDFHRQKICLWLNSNQLLNSAETCNETRRERRIAIMCQSQSLCSLNESKKKISYLTPGTPGLCNLCFHSARLSCDCLKNEKAILERAVSVKRGHHSAQCPALSESSRGHLRSRELWLRYSLGARSTGSIFPRAPPPPPDKALLFSRAIMKADSSAGGHECFVKRGVSVLLGPGGWWGLNWDLFVGVSLAACGFFLTPAAV